MKITNVLTTILLACFVFGDAYGNQKAMEQKPAIEFNGTEYVHRWSNDDQHEYTPEGQSNLSRWDDMLTIKHYRSVNEDKGLASAMESVLENYKKHGGEVLRMDAVRRSPGLPAEHFIAVVLDRPGFSELVQARFRVADGIGESISHSHRIYGAETVPEMKAWSQANAPGLEARLMALEGIPSASLLGKVTGN